MKTTVTAALLTFALSSAAGAADDLRVVWLEAEQFDDTGRWSNDSQHVDLMGSPYLLATASSNGVPSITSVSSN